MLFIDVAGAAFGALAWIDVGDRPVPFLATTGVPLLTALLLWLFADVIARATLARPTRQAFESDLPAAEWQRLAFSTVGVFFAVAALGDVAHQTMRVSIGGAYLGYDMGFDEGWRARVVADAIEFALGVGLMFGARGLVGVLRRFRQFGSAAPSRPADADPSAD
ncbi:MAG TPA: hypothetical protein VFG21_02470 [Xanthomonadaceae bacterium]|nr:hypothetical protein [Xanthomonadaceae bacterium]